MSALLGLVQNEAADSSIAFRDRVYRRGEQGEFLRDVIALANAAVVGRRFLFLGVDDRPGRARRFPGITARTWKKFCQVVPAFLERAVEPHLAVTLESVQVDGVLVGAMCLEGCEDPPYLLARRIGPNMPAGGGWVRRGVKLRRLLRDHLQKIFQARFRRQEIGDVTVGFPGELPREELLLPVLPVDHLPSMRAAHKVNRMIEANEMSRAVLGRSDSRIARLVHAQVSGEDIPYCEKGTGTMRVMLRKIPLEHAAADDHYQFEVRARRLNLLLSNLADKPQTDLVLTLKIPRIEGVGVADRLYPAPGEPAARPGRYPKVDVGPRTIVVQKVGIRIPRRATIEAFYEPLRLWLRETASGQTIRVGYVLQGPTMEKPVQGRLKIFVID